MVGLATGVDPSGQLMATTVSVDYLASEIRQVSAAIDPDGARPREERAKRRRRFRLGTADDDGLIPLSARLTPEVGLRLKGLLEASRRSPRFVAGAAKLATSDPITDDLSATAAGEEFRTQGQRAHDAFAELLMAFAASEGTPQLDGQAVCVIVTVSARDLEDSDGLAGDPIGTMAGSAFPVSRNTVERFIDGGGHRTVAQRDQHARLDVDAGPGVANDRVTAIERGRVSLAYARNSVQDSVSHGGIAQIAGQDGIDTRQHTP